MSFRFQRTYKLMIGKKRQDKNAIVIEPPFRLSFDIEKTVESKPNENTIKVYNLSETTRKAIEKPDLRCVLYAGYKQENNTTLLAMGDIATAYSYRDGADWVTEIYFLDFRRLCSGCEFYAYFKRHCGQNGLIVSGSE